jgi:hypothetical protein
MIRMTLWTYTTLTDATLRDLWPLDQSGQPLLALLCATARDPVLRASASMVIKLELGAKVTAQDFEETIEESFPGVYARSTRRATAQKLGSSWSQSGHLHAEQRQKTRIRAACTSTDVAYALLLGHLQGIRGQALFETLWARILDQPISHLFDLAVTASQHGILEVRHAGGVVDVSFHQLLRPFDTDGQRRLL